MQSPMKLRMHEVGNWPYVGGVNDVGGVPSPRSPAAGATGSGARAPRRQELRRRVARGLGFAGALWLGVAAGATLGHANPLKFDPAEVNFGARAQNQTLTREVKMTNTSAKEIHVLSVSSDCSCTAGEPRQQRLAPGESTVIPVHLQTKTFLGPLLRRLTVHTTEGDGELRVRVEIRPFEQWDVSPNPVVFPASRRDQEIAAAVTATPRDGAKWRVLSAATDQPWLNAELDGAGVGPGRTVQLRKRVAAPAGPHMALLTLTTDDPRQPQLALKVFVPVTSAVRVAPNPVILPSTRVGAAAQREVVVSGWEDPEPPVPRLASGTVEARGRRPNGDFVFAVSVLPATPGMHTDFLKLAAADQQIAAEVPVMVKAEPR